VTCPKCERHFLTPDQVARGLRCRCATSFHCPCAGACTPGCACEVKREAPPPPGQHDFSVRAVGVRIAYCRRCAQPDLEANKRRPCTRALAPSEAERRIARKLEMLKGLRGGGGATNGG